MPMRYLACRVLPTVATLVVAFGLFADTASAFFPPIIEVNEPGGSGPQNPFPPIPPVPPNPFPPPPPPPPGPDPHEHCGCPRPHDVPEPATVATALIGLGALGVAGVRKAMKKKDEPKA